MIGNDLVLTKMSDTTDGRVIRTVQLKMRSLHPYVHPIFDKGGKYIQWRKDSLFAKWCWENWTAMYKRREGNGNPLQYSCLENPMGEGDW